MKSRNKMMGWMAAIVVLSPILAYAQPANTRWQKFQNKAEKRINAEPKSGQISKDPLLSFCSTDPNTLVGDSLSTYYYANICPLYRDQIELQYAKAYYNGYYIGITIISLIVTSAPAVLEKFIADPNDYQRWAVATASAGTIVVGVNDAFNFKVKTQQIKDAHEKISATTSQLYAEYLMVKSRTSKKLTDDELKSVDDRVKLATEEFSKVDNK